MLSIKARIDWDITILHKTWRWMNKRAGPGHALWTRSGPD